MAPHRLVIGVHQHAGKTSGVVDLAGSQRHDFPLDVAHEGAGAAQRRIARTTHGDVENRRVVREERHAQDRSLAPGVGEMALHQDADGEQEHHRDEANTRPRMSKVPAQCAIVTPRQPTDHTRALQVASSTGIAAGDDLFRPQQFFRCDRVQRQHEHTFDQAGDERHGHRHRHQAEEITDRASHQKQRQKTGDRSKCGVHHWPENLNGAINGRCGDGFPFFQMSLDVVDHHDGVAHQHARHQDQTHHRQFVEARAGQPEVEKRSKNREHYARDRQQRRTPGEKT